MSSKVVLQAVDSRTFKLALRDVRFAKFNEKLTGPEPENWRFMHTPEPEETTSEYKTVLESPVEFTMVEGEIKEISLPVRRPPGPSTLRSPSSPS